MIFDTYKNDERIWLTTAAGPTPSGRFAFRGDFVIKHGAMNEAAKKRNPPEAMIKEAVMLFDDEKILMVAGNLADVRELAVFIERFAADLADGCRPIFYIDNLKDSAVIEVDGHTYALISFNSGMIWNELLDICYLEKSDLKGQSTEEKVETVYGALGNFKPKFAQGTLDGVIETRTGARREAWGAI